MFAKHTVFILGAGASAPYDYPTGMSLVRLIVANSETSEEVQIRKSAGFTDEEFEAFKNDVRFSNSVDAFLEHRPDYLNIGKFLIAQRLIARELLSNLLAWQDERQDTWYPYLRDFLITDKESFKHNRVSFITFNYDRSLEQYLHSALKSRYGWNDEIAADNVAAISFIHVHGTLGALPWQAQSQFTREYRPTQNPQAILETSKAIRIVSDASDLSAFDSARQLIAQAEHIVILGFAYAEVNMRRLGIVNILKDKTNPESFTHGTAYGFKDIERSELRRKYPGINFDTDERQIISLIRKTHRFLIAANGG